MTHLPQEIINRFIDEFYDSVKDLKILTLVAKSWLHRARQHLFRSLTLVPQDLQAIRDKYANVKRRDSYKILIDPNDFLTEQDRHFLHSPLAENPQATQTFLSSITDTLPFVRGLRLLPHVQVGGEKILAREYLHDWLGYGGDEHASRCRLRWRSSSYEDYLERRQATWDSVDLPWARGAGLHALPFRNLRFLEIQWSVFIWTPPSERGLVGPANPKDWPAYQLAMLVKSNGGTLEYVSIDEYPGFRLEQSDSTLNGDGLLDLLAKNAPNLRSLYLGGLREASYPQLDLVQPQGFEDFLSDSRPLYISGEEIPDVMLGDDSFLERPTIPSDLERLFIRGFDSESTTLIEDALLNRGIFSVKSLTHLTLSVMPKGYDYMFMFSKVQKSLTHLTLDLKDSNGSMPVVQVIKLLHISFGPSALLPVNGGYLLSASVDELFANLVCMHPELPESMGQTQVEKITLDLPETILADTLPIAFQTGHLKEGKTDYWWYKPEYLWSKV
ncbi:hypothetical protein F5880DRAFT_1511488 [Lentinula raphanica]|nr:hypothetical protein F5880DRAFT_1511488 [Lentinula raphanica]